MTCNRSAITAGAAAILCALACDFEARAQQFPTQPVHLILGFAPGGITDFTGRVVAQQLSKILGGNPVVPENRPGAAGANAWIPASNIGLTPMAGGSSHGRLT